MPRIPINLATDALSLGRLAIDAVSGVTGIVESLHLTISSLGGIFAASGQNRTTGITGTVYGSIRKITALVGSGVDAVLERIAAVPGETDHSPGREAAVSVLNGLLGNHLSDRKNPLAISMQFRRNGRTLDGPTLHRAAKDSDGRIAVMVHGLCMNDMLWKRMGHDHGEALARDLGVLPVYLRYNTGRHISENGRELSELLEAAIDGLPRQAEIYLIGHSMGGLVSRSACHYGRQAGHAWLDHLRKLVFLGTPHHGTLLERGGNWINTILDINPYSAPVSRLGKIRSCGITDLRFGNLVDEDWSGRSRFGFSRDQRLAVFLPEGVACYSIAARSRRESGRLGDHLVGDGLVPLSSALGRHRNPRLNLPIPENRQWVGCGISHMDLLSHPEVYATLKGWLAD